MRPSKFIIVAIDGGAASGKSSTSRALSERFSLMHVDTGSFYRAISAELLRRGVRPSDVAGVHAALAGLVLGTRIDGRLARMELGGRVLPEEEIRSAEVNAAVSHFAAIPEVRAALLAYQRGQADVARERGFAGLVMEGRDIGSVIFPDADLRFFLHADPEERARRRAREGVQDAVAERDRLDTTRKAAPLACPSGAIDIDSTHLTLEQVVEVIAGTIAEKLKA
ncbi:(d)CMP kinase [Opitutaceae bacterium TAV4]|nr:(d)CMP kinase [Opitutaceae bacterium TAV4]RRK00542.1 (d)CMP kinase [Opitutaceae bacterium TAV3]RRK00627.1 (d)CMP kinase [Opitutaceae bacterium TAV3]